MNREKILIAEDELDLLDLIDFNLTNAGYRTCGVLDGQEAFRQINIFHPDLIVLDLMLPKLDGWSLCERMKREEMEIPILMLTAKGAPEDKVRGFEIGAADYMTKPFEVKELLARINRVLERKRSGEMQRMIVHEVTNRLTTIGCYSRILSGKEEAPLDETTLGYLKDIASQVCHTTELVYEISTLIDLETGGFALDLRPCDVRGLVRSVSGSFGEAAARKGVEIVCDGREALPDIHTDPRAVRQILTNLVGNAVKYSDEGGRVEVRAEPAPEGVAVTVRNNGPGIPPEERERIFEKGFRGAAAGCAAHGSGLGLYFVKRLSERLRARVEVEGEPGNGATFRVTIGSIYEA
ncbi:MAG: ATP-binding protein [Thermodesulfobacteriota bacterium]